MCTMDDEPARYNSTCVHIRQETLCAVASQYLHDGSWQGTLAPLSGPYLGATPMPCAVFNC